MTEPAHYAHGPSSAAKWLRCTESPFREAEYPDDTCDAADEGTAAHWLLEQCLGFGCTAEEAALKFDGIVPAAEEIGTLKEWPITGEMIEAVQVHIDLVTPDIKKKGTRLFVEERVRLDPYLDLPVPVGGTADTIWYLPRSKILRVADFKYGKHHVIEVDDPEFVVNPQLGCYALGALLELKRLMGKEAEVKWIEVYIVQPRAYHKAGPVRRKKITPLQLMDLELAIIRAARTDSREYRAGDHCDHYFCSHRQNCPAYAQARSDRALESFTAETPDPYPETRVEPVPATPPTEQLPALLQRPVKGLTLDELGQARELCKVLNDWMSEIHSEVYVRLEHGLAVPGAKLVEGRGSRQYGGAPEEIAQALASTAAALDVGVADLHTEPGLLSPAQLEKKFGKSKFKGTPLAKLVTTTTGAPRVDDADSDRQEYVENNGFTAEESPLL